MEILNPANQVDRLLFDAAQEFSSEPPLQRSLRQVSKTLLGKAIGNRNYFLGLADPSSYAGLSPEFIRESAAGVAALWYAELGVIDAYDSERLANVIAKKAGVLPRLSELEDSDYWERTAGGGLISISLDGSGRVMDRNNQGLYYTGRIPLLQLGKRFLRYDQPGRWNISIYVPAGTFVETLDTPLEASKFDIVQS